MLDRVPDRNIWLINGATVLFGVSCGIAISILAIFLKRLGYAEKDIGNLAFWFGLGIVSAALPAGAVIRRLSAKTLLVMSVMGYACTVAVFPYVAHSFELAAAVRFVDGVCSVGVWVGCETIILSRAESDKKAYVTSLYAISIGVGYVLGPAVSWLVVLVASHTAAFWLAGAISTLSALILLWQLDPDVKHDEPVASGGAPPSQTSSSTLTWQIKTSLFGTFAYGYFQASAVLFLPLFLIHDKGMPEDQTILVPGVFALGMLLFCNYAGQLGDRFGHLLVMRLLSAVGTTMVLGFVMVRGFPLMLVAVFVAGATLASISPVSLALQGIIAAPRDYHRSNAIYNAFYASGILLGPLVSSRIFQAHGGTVLIYQLAGLWVGFFLFSIVYAKDDPHARAAAPASSA